MNANELADGIEKCTTDPLHKQAATMLRQQQVEIEALKKACLDEITKRVYADQSTKVIEGYWEEAQAEIKALKNKLEQYEILEIMITDTLQKAQEK